MNLNNLNPRQKEAVEGTDGPLLIIAGAGAGKTKTLTSRISHLISKGIDPKNILAITFTNKAAKEMRDRVLTLISQRDSFDSRPLISTFHSLGVKILREMGKEIGISPRFSIFDRGDSEKALKTAMKKLDFDPKEYNPSSVLSVISRAKGEGENYQTMGNKNIALLWQGYENILSEEKALDFDDLLTKTVLLLEKSDIARNHYQNLWQYIHIDEYQDTNKIQYRIAKILAAPQNNICVVGDADQTIYTWRGATIENIMKFEKDFPNSSVVLLEENYRSTRNILSAANNVISKNKNRHKKNLFTSNSSGESITIYNALDQNDEARFVAETSAKLISSGTDPNQIAVLYRANFQSRALEERFLAKNVPYQVIGTRFYERKEIKEVLSYIKFAINPDSMSDLKRIINVPVRGIGKVGLLKILSKQSDSLPPKTKAEYKNFLNRIEKIKNIIQQKTPADVVLEVSKISGIEEMYKNDGPEGVERIENIKELANLASRYEDMESFLTEVALASDQDALEDKKEKSGVRFMTVHASKGLEFDHVFVVGLEEGLFPHEKMDSKTDDEEERRLFYVAITRAKKKLYLCHATMRTIFGSTNVSVPSQFLEDVLESEVEVEEISFEKKFRDEYDTSIDKKHSSAKDIFIDF